MKLQIDTERKTIKLETNTNLGEFFSKIEVLIPDWKDWTLETNVVINWSNPIVIRTPYRFPYDTTPWPHITWCGTANNNKLTTTSVYNVEV